MEGNDLLAALTDYRYEDKETGESKEELKNPLETKTWWFWLTFTLANLLAAWAAVASF